MKSLSSNQNSSTLQAVEKGEKFVVDSRLIAEELGIQHKNFLATIEKYKEEIEEDLEPLAFETRLVKRPQGGSFEEKWSWLTEEQAQVLMTYSKNTEKVRQCKRSLVKAFAKAKKVIKEQSAELERLRLELALAKEQNKLADSQSKLLATVHLLETVSPGLAPLALGKADAVVERIEYIDRTITPNAIYEGVGIGYIRKKLGFKTDKQAWAWLDSIGYGKHSGIWELQLAAVEHHKLPPHLLNEVVKKFAKHEGDRQLLLGE